MSDFNFLLQALGAEPAAAGTPEASSPVAVASKPIRRSNVDTFSLVQKEAKRYGIDPEFASSMVITESGGNSNAESGALNG
jgi:soluble lytic murein transglycosylase-like protein